MRTRVPRRLLLTAVLLPLLAAAMTAAAPPRAVGAALPFQDFLVAFKPRASRAARLGVVSRLGLQTDGRVKNPHFARLKVAAAARGRVNPAAVLRALRRDPAVRVAEPDFKVRLTAVPNDTFFREQWGMHNTGQEVTPWGGMPDADIDAPEAWDLTTGSASVVVAVIDSGVDYLHPDLAPNMWTNPGEIPDNGLDDDGNGWGDDVHGINTLDGSGDPLDDHSHGTHVAGIVGARGNNGLGVTGVAPNVRIMALKFVDATGSGTVAGAITCIDYARQAGAHILNNSYIDPAYSQLLREAVERAAEQDILFVAAAGNFGEDNDSNPGYPANLSRMCDNVITVTASETYDEWPGFSNYGDRTVDIAAPGQDVFSTIPGGSYDFKTGTSMAAPHVAGAAALLKAHYPGLTAVGMRARLRAGADRVPGFAGLVASGRLNVFRSLAADTTPPAAATGLEVTHVSSAALRVRWLAPGDDGTAGAATLYQLRYGTSPVTAANFHLASHASAVPVPAAAGTEQSFFLTGLDAGTTYYLAMRAVDDAGNLSPLAATSGHATAASPRLLNDTVESGQAFTGWSVTTAESVSPGSSYTDSPGGSYANGADMVLAQNAAVTPAGAAVLKFQAKADLEAGADHLFVEVTRDGGTTWEPQVIMPVGAADWLESLTGNSEGWRPHWVPLHAFAGQSIRVRFRMTSDESVTGDGVYLDDIRITDGLPVVTQLLDTVEGTPLFSGPAPWGVTAERSFSPTRSYADSPGATIGEVRDDSLEQMSGVTLLGHVPLLLFQGRRDLTPGLDFLHLDVSADGGQSWERVRTATGPAEWAAYALPLTEFYGQSVRIRFNIWNLFDFGGDGVHLDDIRLCGEQLRPAKFSIRGTVRSGGAGVAGVAVTDGRRRVTTAADGTYVLEDLAPGTYLLRPLKGGYSFAPASRMVTVGPDRTGIDFTGAEVFSISGTVTRGGAGVAGALVRAGGRSAMTDAGGNYTLTGLPAALYTVTASVSGSTVSPSFRLVSLGPSASGVNFTAQ